MDDSNAQKFDNEELGLLLKKRSERLYNYLEINGFGIERENEMVSLPIGAKELFDKCQEIIDYIKLHRCKFD